MTRPIQAARLLCALVFSGVVSACTVAPPEQRGPGSVFDPYENTNRSIHQFNRTVDRVFFRPASKGYVTIFPDEAVTSFSNFADNIGEPGNLVNGVLQGNPKRASRALVRFAINSTFGILGLIDAAGEFGIPADKTDFGETLHVWGANEGAFVELPFFGPSNERDAVGLVADFFTNPIGFANTNKADNIGAYAEVVQRMGDRGRYADTVDSILYESADSYAQSRIIYLQNRRFELAGEGQEEYSDPYESVYDDPYEDPYAQ